MNQVTLATIKWHFKQKYEAETRMTYRTIKCYFIIVIILTWHKSEFKVLFHQYHPGFGLNRQQKSRSEAEGSVSGWSSAGSQRTSTAHLSDVFFSEVSSESSCLIICISSSGVSGLEWQAISLPLKAVCNHAPSKSSPDFPFSAPQSLPTHWLKKLYSKTKYLSKVWGPYVFERSVLHTLD